MKATLALLADADTANFVTKVAWHLHMTHRIGISARRLPPHISLKQPFDVGDLSPLEVYMAEFAQSIIPFSVELNGFDLWEVPRDNPSSGVLSIRVSEAPTLRALHYRLNQELTARFGAAPADFDGSPYTFHLTIATGVGSVQAYRRALTELEETATPHTFQASALALFVYDNGAGRDDWQYLTYKVLPLVPT